MDNYAESTNGKTLANMLGDDYELAQPESRIGKMLQAILNQGGGGGYTLPTATSQRLGGVKVGANLTVQEDGTLSAQGAQIQKSGGWTYRMDEAGNFEAWYKATGQTYTIGSTTGVLYRSELASLALPEEIYGAGTVEIDYAAVNVAHANYYTWGAVASLYETGINYWAMRAGSRAQNHNYTLTAYILGNVKS